MYGSVNMYKREMERIDNDYRTIMNELEDEIAALGKELNSLHLELEEQREIALEYEADSITWEKCYTNEHELCDALTLENEELADELALYREIEAKTGKTPREIIDLVSNLQGVVDSIKQRQIGCVCGASIE